MILLTLLLFYSELGFELTIIDFYYDEWDTFCFEKNMLSPSVVIVQVYKTVQCY